jgi:hypothetical protein
MAQRLIPLRPSPPGNLRTQRRPGPKNTLPTWAETQSKITSVVNFHRMDERADRENKTAVVAASHLKPNPFFFVPFTSHSAQREKKKTRQSECGGGFAERAQRRP